MKLESGKMYVTRKGMAVGPMRHITGGCAYPFTCDSCNEIWTKDGIYDIEIPDHPLDIVSEYVEPNKMKEKRTVQLESGKRYVCRNGEVTGPLAFESSQTYPFFDTTRPRMDTGLNRWLTDGRFLMEKESHPLDIVSEYNEPQRQELRWRWMKVKSSADASFSRSSGQAMCAAETSISM